MSDELLAPTPARNGRLRNSSLIGGVAFVGGIAVTVAAFQLAPRSGPVEGPRPAVPAPQVQPNATPALQPASDIATLDAREQLLAGRLDQLQLRIQGLEGSARGAAAYATRAEQLMIAAAARRAIERGLPLGSLETQLRQRFGERHPEAVAAIVRGAAQPVTLEDLRLALNTIAPRLTSGSNDSLWMRVRRMLGDLIVLRQADSPSPRAADRLRRARRVLDEGQVEAALAEVAHMPGVDQAESWITAARRYASARAGLNEIERSAVDALPALPAPAPVPAQ
jgi:hypothetical protein